MVFDKKFNTVSKGRGGNTQTHRLSFQVLDSTGQEAGRTEQKRIAGIGWQILEIARNGWKYAEIARHGIFFNLYNQGLCKENLVMCKKSGGYA